MPDKHLAVLYDEVSRLCTEKNVRMRCTDIVTGVFGKSNLYRLDFFGAHGRFLTEFSSRDGVSHIVAARDWLRSENVLPTAEEFETLEQDERTAMKALDEYCEAHGFWADWGYPAHEVDLEHENHFSRYNEPWRAHAYVVERKPWWDARHWFTKKFYSLRRKRPGEFHRTRILRLLLDDAKAEVARREIKNAN